MRCISAARIHWLYICICIYWWHFYQHGVKITSSKLDEKQMYCLALHRQYTVAVCNSSTAADSCRPPC